MNSIGKIIFIFVIITAFCSMSKAQDWQLYNTYNFSPGEPPACSFPHIPLPFKIKNISTQVIYMYVAPAGNWGARSNYIGLPYNTNGIWGGGEVIITNDNISGQYDTTFATWLNWVFSDYSGSIEIYTLNIVPPDTFNLNVAGGNGSGNYAPFTVVDISPIIPAGCHFVKWQSAENLLQDETVAINQIVMPGSDWTVTAVFAEGVENDGIDTDDDVPAINSLKDAVTAGFIGVNERLDTIVDRLDDILEKLVDDSGNAPEVLQPIIEERQFQMPDEFQDLQEEAVNPESFRVDMFQKMRDEIEKLRIGFGDGYSKPPVKVFILSDLPWVGNLIGNISLDFNSFPQGVDDVRIYARRFLSFGCAIFACYSLISITFLLLKV